VRLDVTKSAALSAAVAVMATMPREAAKAVRKYSKVVIQPEWRKGLAEHAPDRLFHDRLVTPSAAYISDRGVKLRAGRAGGFPRETEFGAYREDFTTYTRRKVKGGSTQVTRRTQRQFRHYTKQGHVVYPTARNLIPRIASLWVQTIYRSVHEVIESLGGR
jgi:hypothetical protein